MYMYEIIVDYFGLFSYLKYIYKQIKEKKDII